MPCFRGIEIFISLSPTNDKIPEFPHPEGPSIQVQIRSPSGRNSEDSENSHGPPGSLCSQSSLSVRSFDPRKTQKVDPRVSVYIPSIPGLTFAINYNVTGKLSCKYVFFKLYMNGRSIASWGTDLEHKPKGSVARSFWEPCERFEDHVGVEERNFLFTPGQEKKSIAEDGGLVEIQVFRAKDRRPQAPALEQFRVQDNYGISAPSIGLLEQPEELRFYTFHLIDAKDQPYATFRFHYRSFQSLQQLNLIPDSEPDICQQLTSRAQRSEPVYVEEASVSSEYSSYDDTSDARVEQDQVMSKDTTEENYVQPQDIFGNTPQLRPMPLPNTTLPQPSKALRDAYPTAYLQRPLPELPKDEPCTQSRRSSGTSAASGAPSLTASLMDYVDGGSFDTDEVEVGVAQLARYHRGSSVSRVDGSRQVNDSHVANASVSDNERSRSSPYDSDAPDLSCSGDYVDAQEGDFTFNSEAVLFAPDEEPATSERVKTVDGCPGLEGGCDGKRRVRGTLGLSESEWMRRTPSPTRERTINPVSRMWSPGLRLRSNMETLPSFGGERSAGNSGEAFRNPRLAGFRQEHPPPVPFHGEIDGTSGTWI